LEFAFVVPDWDGKTMAGKDNFFGCLLTSEHGGAILLFIKKYCVNWVAIWAYVFKEPTVFACSLE
jgi:hypothetical protein